MRVFGPFNQILLSLFDVLNAFHDSIELFTSFNSFSLQCLLKNAFKTSNKFNKI